MKKFNVGQTVKATTSTRVPARYRGRRGIVVDTVKRGNGFAAVVSFPQRTTPLTVATRFLAAV